MNIKRLEEWYLVHQRKLPFRETHNPYDIWVSEIMLQQTQMETVIPFFNKFIERFPTIEDLAKASEAELLNTIQGLGYYRRFHHMHKAANMVINQFHGQFPKTYAEIISLPGVGKYTAGAILSIAYNQPYSATDGNVIRVLSRLHGNDANMRIEKNRKMIESLNQHYIESSTPRVYTQALMELGALICRPSQPKCEDCPLINDCMAYQKNIQTDLPVLSKKPNKKVESYMVYIVEEDNSFYLRKRNQTLLQGMYELPQYSKGQEVDFEFEVLFDHGMIDHIFTHLRWQMEVKQVRLISDPPKDWVRVQRLHLNDYPMATAHKKIIKKTVK